MVYNSKDVLAEVVLYMEKNRFKKKDGYEFLNVSQQTFDNIIQKGDTSLSNFLRLCELLKLNPSIFFSAENIIESTVQIGERQSIKQFSNNVHHSDNEIALLKMKIEGLEKENALLKELNEVLKSR